MRSSEPGSASLLLLCIFYSTSSSPLFGGFLAYLSTL